VNGLREGCRPGQLDNPLDSETQESAQVVSLADRRAERLLARLDYYRAKIDRAVDLIEGAHALRELLHMGVMDLDDAVGAVDSFKRAVAAFRRGSP
jgi:hypothetical protein